MELTSLQKLLESRKLAMAYTGMADATALIKVSIFPIDSKCSFHSAILLEIISFIRLKRCLIIHGKVQEALRICPNLPVF